MTVFLVTSEIKPSEINNPEAKFYNKIQLKSNHLFTNKSHDRFFVYQLFENKQLAQRKINQLKKISIRQTFSENSHDKWFITGGTIVPEEFTSLDDCKKYIKKYTKRFFKIKVY